MKRMQRQRTKGWRMPKGAVYVGRPTRWGNPYRIPALTADQAVRAYRIVLTYDPDHGLWWLNIAGRFPQFFSLEPLRGKDLVCWCPLDQPCHADVLLELANR